MTSILSKTATANFSLLILSIFGIFIHNINSQCLTDNDQEQQLIPTSRSNLYQGQQTFTISLLNSINQATPNENVFFSPYSTYHALLLAYFGSKNETEKELADALNLNWSKNKFHVMNAYRTALQMYARRSKNASYDFISADKIFVSKSAELKTCMKSLFNNELETLDFAGDPQKCRNYINEWIEKTTRSQIKDVLQPDDVTTQTNIILANAAYFKGIWASKFDPNDTKDEIFYASEDKQTFVKMMNKQGNFNLGVNERLGAHILELPYLGDGPDDISMMILLPPFRTDGINNILNNLTPETLKEALNDLTSREVEIKIPKFNFEKTLELVPILQRMGIKTLFTPKSNLSGFSDKVNLQFGDAIHKAKIEVDEEGSTAAAATVLFTFRSAKPIGPSEFKCDHPFIFLIYDNKLNSILFTGIYRGPEK